MRQLKPKQIRQTNSYKKTNSKIKYKQVALRNHRKIQVSKQNAFTTKLCLYTLLSRIWISLLLSINKFILLTIQNRYTSVMKIKKK
jgi:hypothetical protein